MHGLYSSYPRLGFPPTRDSPSRLSPIRDQLSPLTVRRPGQPARQTLSSGKRPWHGWPGLAFVRFSSSEPDSGKKEQNIYGTNSGSLVGMRFGLPAFTMNKRRLGEEAVFAAIHREGTHSGGRNSHRTPKSPATQDLNRILHDEPTEHLSQDLCL